MRAVRYHEFGGPEKLQFEQIPRPELGSENVLIQITRAGVSRLDDKVRRGVLPPSMLKPLPLGGDVTGQALSTLLQQVGSGTLKPAIERVYPLDQAAEAQRRV